jgi:hypothetical protein
MTAAASAIEVTSKGSGFNFFITLLTINSEFMAERNKEN